MKKSNLIKGILCGLMFTAVVGTSGFAATRELTNYYLETYEKNAYLGTITSSDYSVPTLTPGGNDYAYIVRDYDNPLYDYYHYGKSYYSTQSTSVVIDNYECIVRQYR